MKSQQSGQTIRQLAGFMIVGALGVVVNGVVYSFFALFSWGNYRPIPFAMFNELKIAWFLGILVAFVFNFVLDKIWVFKA